MLTKLTFVLHYDALILRTASVCLKQYVIVNFFVVVVLIEIQNIRPGSVSIAASRCWCLAKPVVENYPVFNSGGGCSAVMQK